MSVIILINCKHYSTFGNCHHPKNKRFWIFKRACPLSENRNTVCNLQEKYPKPKGPPPPPPLRPKQGVG